MKNLNQYYNFEKSLINYIQESLRIGINDTPEAIVSDLINKKQLFCICANYTKHTIFYDVQKIDKVQIKDDTEDKKLCEIQMHSDDRGYPGSTFDSLQGGNLLYKIYVDGSNVETLTFLVDPANVTKEFIEQFIGENSTPVTISDIFNALKLNNEYELLQDELHNIECDYFLSEEYNNITAEDKVAYILKKLRIK